MLPNTSYVPFSDLPLLYWNNDYNHRSNGWKRFFSLNGIPESLGLKGTCTDKPIQSLYSKQVSYNRLLRPMSSHTPNVSIDTSGDFTDFLGNLCQCVTTLQEQKSIFLYSDETMSFHLCPFSCHWTLPSSLPPIKLLNTLIISILNFLQT